MASPLYQTGAPDLYRYTPGLSPSGAYKDPGVPGMLPSFPTPWYSGKAPSSGSGDAWTKARTSPDYWRSFYADLPYIQQQPKYALTPPGLGSPVAPVWPATQSAEAYYPSGTAALEAMQPGSALSATTPGGTYINATTPANGATLPQFYAEDPLLAENGLKVGPDGHLVPITPSGGAASASPSVPAPSPGLPIPVQGPNGYWYIPKSGGGYTATHKTNLYDVPGYGVSWRSPNFGFPDQALPLFGAQGSPVQKMWADALRMAQGPGGLIGQMLGMGPGRSAGPTLSDLLGSTNPAQRQAGMSALNPAQVNSVINREDRTGSGGGGGSAMTVYNSTASQRDDPRWNAFY